MTSFNKKGHADGGKIAGSHTTVIETARPLVKTAAALACVKKITLSVIRGVPGGQPRLKITQIPAGLHLQVRSPKAVQQIYVYTSERDQVEQALRRAFTG